MTCYTCVNISYVKKILGYVIYDYKNIEVQMLKCLIGEEEKDDENDRPKKRPNFAPSHQCV